MKSAISNKISFIVVLIGMAVLANLKVGASVKMNGEMLRVEGSKTTVAAPTAKDATKIGATSFQANWSYVAGVDGYKVYVYKAGKGGPVYVTGYNPKSVAGAKIMKATVSGLSSSTTYYFALKAVKGEGKGAIYSDLSNVISVTTTAATTYVPDNNFEQALIDKGFDDVLDDYVLTANINTLTVLNVGSKSIADLTGIEDFVALTNLICYFNSLASLDVSKNTALEKLYCDANQLQSLDVSKNTDLTYLRCYRNQLQSLDVSQNTDLTYLSCYDNQLASLDVSQNLGLTYLSCYSNQLTSLNVKNGNNSNIENFESRVNPNLSCIEVDDPALALTYIDWNKDATANYSENCTAPAAPVAAAATNITSSSFQANWEASIGATGYELTIVAGIPGEIGLHEPVAGYDGKEVSVTSFVLPENTLLPGNNYYYYIKAANSNGTSTKSNSISVVTIPAPPVTIAATEITATSFRANWEASVGASAYKLFVLGELSEDPGSFSAVASYNGILVTETSFAIPENTLEPGVNYRYYVKANNSGGESPYSFGTSVTTLESMLPAPEINETSNIRDSSFYAKWHPVGNASEYKLTAYTKTLVGDTVFLDDYNPKILNRNFTGTHVIDLNPGTTYYWYVRAVGLGGDSDKSETETVTTKMTGTNSLEVTNVTSTSCKINWSPVAGALEYRLWVYNNDDEYVEGFGPKSLTDTSFDLAGLLPNTDYYIAVSVLFISGESVRTSSYKITTSRHTLVLSANPVAGGMVNVSYSFVPEKQATVQATVNEGYIFVNWTENGTEVSTNASYTFTFTEDRTLVANFAVAVTTNTLSLSATPSEGGTVTEDVTVNTGTTVTAQATANDGYVFVNWTEDGTEVSTETSFTFSLNTDRTLVANFAVAVTTNTLSLSATPSEGGTVSGGGTINTGTSVTAQATANDGYVFVNWTEDGTEVSTETSFSFALNTDRTLVATFAVAVTTNTLSLSATPSEGGTVTGDGIVNTGTSVTAQVTANEGYVFVNWTEDGTEVSTETSYTFALNANRTLIANFRLTTGIDNKNTAPIAVWPNPTSTILNISEIPIGSSLKITSLLGQVVIQKNDCNNRESWNVESLKNGIYIIVIENNITSYSQKFIKR